MSYIAARRADERMRRRAEILDAAETLYLKKGWAGLTVEQLARSARLSRALVYVYFRNKEELLFGIGERATRILHDRFKVAITTADSGLDQVEAIARAYLRYAHEFPHYFDFCSRFQTHSAASDPSSSRETCEMAGEQLLGIVVQAVETGIRDGSIVANVSNPVLLAITLWAFTHGIVQRAIARGAALERQGHINFSDYAFLLLRRIAKGNIRSLGPRMS
jgi:AcrR family transcriptional regulator